MSNSQDVHILQKLNWKITKIWKHEC